MADPTPAPETQEAEDEQTVTPWDVKASEKGIDYGKLISKLRQTHKHKHVALTDRISTAYRTVRQREN